MSELLMAGGALTKGFNVETSITWHALWWAEGTNFVAQGYTDGNSVDPWPDEVNSWSASNSGGTDPVYRAADTDWNNQPVVDFNNTAAVLEYTGAQGFTAPTYPVSVVALGKFHTVTAQRVMCTGDDNTHENRIQVFTSGWGINAGTNYFAGTEDTLPHLFVAYYDGSTGNDWLEVDGTVEVGPINSGSEQLDGFTIGNFTSRLYADHDIALIAIYEGDFTADSKYSDFCTWAEDHYGLTIA